MGPGGGIESWEFKSRRGRIFMMDDLSIKILSHKKILFQGEKRHRIVVSVTWVILRWHRWNLEYLFKIICRWRYCYWRKKQNRRAEFEYRPRMLRSLSHKCPWVRRESISSLPPGLNSRLEWDSLALGGSPFGRRNLNPWRRPLEITPHCLS